jgi:hypothetical protein
MPDLPWLDRIKFHCTPQQCSWLNMAEMEIGIMNRQCLDQRLNSLEQIATEVTAWENQRNALKARVH